MCLAVDAIENDLHTFEWTWSRIACAQLSLSWKEDLVNFPKLHPLHVSTCSSVPLGRPIEICYMIFKVPWCKWPNHLCQNSQMSQLRTFSANLSCGYVEKECLSLTKDHIIASILQHENRYQVLLQTRNIHNISQSEGSTWLPLKGNCTQTGSTIPPVITHLDMHLEILLLQVT